MKLDLVYNPSSGGFRRAKLEQLVAALEHFDWAVTLIETRPDGVTLSSDCELVCVHGGDGALRQTVCGLGKRAGKIPICISPAGTINLVARELGYHADPDKFAVQVAAAWGKGPQRWLRSPLFTFDDMPVLACMSIGPDSVAVSGVSTSLKAKIGRYAYVISAMKMLARWPQDPMPVKAQDVDGRIFEMHGEAVFVARGKFYAGPFSLSPNSELSASTLELVVIERSTRLACLRFALAVMIGRDPAKLGLAKTFTVKWAEIGDGDLPTQVDGDQVTPVMGRIEPSGQVVRYCV
ncbi:diacylglycerol kinase family protein [Altererythrobacter sp. ZODW24]|uniref:diacylglycerol/lipid kinase family protein n=1 Tax=Altererythrobacter sp. ZODW24 TaxID=2185142 RepID=UPI000DF797C0|nr:diacylglycerol kinase family protein [Altererythrobacter sp. ZODW24]